jgi:hypothetical protein
MNQKTDLPTNPTIMLALSLWSKIDEQIELTKRLMALIPADQLQWRPNPEVFRIGDLLGHLLETAAGFCAALYALCPDQLGHFINLREQPVNHFCGAEEAIARLSDYQKHIEEGFALLDDKDLKRSLPTRFLPAGESALTILLGNFEHLINHKYQLFFYLKLLGVIVKTPELYHFRGAPTPE